MKPSPKSRRKEFIWSNFKDWKGVLDWGKFNSIISSWLGGKPVGA